MKLLCDPFFKRLTVALALYAAMIVLWMHSPLPAPNALPALATAAPGTHTN